VISYNQIIPVINHLLLEPMSVGSFVFNPPHLCNLASIKPAFASDHFCGRAIWYHEEPLSESVLENLLYYVDRKLIKDETIYNTGTHSKTNDVNITILINSEKSRLKTDWLRCNPIYDWYFFFHGFLTLDWYRDYKFYKFELNNNSKLFSCFNHLISEKRSYRLYAISRLFQEKLQNHGNISCPKLSKDLLKQEIRNTNSFLDKKSKSHIYNNLMPHATAMLLDEVNYNESSATISPYLINANWNIVTETVYFDHKLHLTEKIFKPIVCQRPFMLLAAPGNLAYLKSYGFETFDKWINEDYDNIENPYQRIDFVINELKKLAQMSDKDRMIMDREIQAVCEFNHNHFYNKFPKILVNELVDNFETCAKQYNVGRFCQRHRFAHNVDFSTIKDRLLQFV
jgi:hypothetical protein